MSAGLSSVWLLLAGLVLLVPAPPTALLRARVRSPVGRAAPARGRDGERTHSTDALAARLTRREVRWTVGVALGSAAFISGARPLAAVTAGLVALGSMAAARRAVAAQRSRRAMAELRTALTLLAAELSAGANEPEALRSAAGVSPRWSPALREAARVADRGGDVAVGLLDAGPALAQLAAAWRVRAACGAALAALVNRVERDVAAADGRNRDVDAALAGPRSSALVLAALPLVGIALGAAMGADPLRFLVRTELGSVLLLVGALFDGLGLWWIARMAQLGSRR